VISLVKLVRAYNVPFVFFGLEPPVVTAVIRFDIKFEAVQQMDAKLASVQQQSPQLAYIQTSDLEFSKR
jgi:hypothetical protein